MNSYELFDCGSEQFMNQSPRHVARFVSECMQLRETKPDLSRHFEDYCPAVHNLPWYMPKYECCHCFISGWNSFSRQGMCWCLVSLLG